MKNPTQARLRDVDSFRVVQILAAQLTYRDGPDTQLSDKKAARKKGKGLFQHRFIGVRVIKL
jgi:hypothetical protein